MADVAACPGCRAKCGSADMRSLAPRGAVVLPTHPWRRPHSSLHAVGLFICRRDTRQAGCRPRGFTRSGDGSEGWALGGGAEAGSRRQLGCPSDLLVQALRAALPAACEVSGTCDKMCFSEFIAVVSRELHRNPSHITAGRLLASDKDGPVLLSFSKPKPKCRSENSVGPVVMVLSCS